MSQVSVARLPGSWLSGQIAVMPIRSRNNELMLSITCSHQYQESCTAGYTKLWGYELPLPMPYALKRELYHMRGGSDLAMRDWGTGRHPFLWFCNTCLICGLNYLRMVLQTAKNMKGSSHKNLSVAIRCVYRYTNIQEIGKSIMYNITSFE